MNCDVLNLEWSSSGRDREVASLICHTLRGRGYTVVEDSIFNYRYLLPKLRPRLFYVADPAGARVNYEAVLYAERLGIPSISVEAEGNYAEDIVEEMFWGHVADRQLHERLKLQWSTRSREMARAVAPHLRERLKVCGAVGFDRYRLQTFLSKQDLRRKYGFAQDRVVGFASGAFDQLSSVQAVIDRWTSSYGQATISRFLEDRDALRGMLAELIRRRRDTLFVLKQHPGVVAPTETEIAGLERFENVLLIANEESISDCISACDVWMAYDSTTCVEAWLLDKPTLFINPSGGDFPRANVHGGTPILELLEDVENALDDYYALGRIPAFDAKHSGRSQVLRDTLQWVDGKNHLRAVHYFERLLAEAPAHRPPAGGSVPLAAHAQNLLLRAARFLPPLPAFEYYRRAGRRFDRAELERAERRVSAATASHGLALSDEELSELDQVNA
jgi:surface carbohydrate biosynthesis protein